MADGRKKKKSRGGGAVLRFTTLIKENKEKYRNIMDNLTRESLNAVLQDDAVRNWAQGIDISTLKAYISKIVGESTTGGAAEEVSPPDLERIMRNVWSRVVTHLQEEGPVIRTRPTFSTERENSYFDAFLHGYVVSGVEISPKEKEVMELVRKGEKT
jgi:hypothetical protein